MLQYINRLKRKVGPKRLILVFLHFTGPFFKQHHFFDSFIFSMPLFKKSKTILIIIYTIILIVLIIL